MANIPVQQLDSGDTGTGGIPGTANASASTSRSGAFNNAVEGARGAAGLMRNYVNNVLGTMRGHPRATAASAALTGTSLLAAPFVISGMRARQNDPERIASLPNGGLDPNGQAGEELRQAASQWDEDDWRKYRSALANSQQQSVRLGDTTPQQAQQRIARFSYEMPDQDALSPSANNSVGTVNNPATNQVQSFSNSDLNYNYPGGAHFSQSVPTQDYASTYGDPNDLGLPTGPQAQQMADYSKFAARTTEDINDLMVGREFDRTMRYRRPVERDRNQETFAITEAQQRNANRRLMASNLLTSYADTARQLVTAGL